MGCLILLVKFSRREGLRLHHLIGPIRLRWGYDVVLGLGCFLLCMQAFSWPVLLANKLVFGATHPRSTLVSWRQEPFLDGRWFTASAYSGSSGQRAKR